MTETFPPDGNGVAMTLARLVDALRERGHAVELVRPRQDQREPSSDLLVGGFPIPRYPGLRAGFPAFGRLLGRWRERRPDVVHVATEGPVGWSAVRAARALSLPVSSSFHTNFHRYSRYYGLGWMQRPIRAYLRALHNSTDVTLVPTKRLAQELDAEGFLRLGVLGRGVDRRLFHPGRRDPALRERWGAGDGRLVVLYVGRIAAEKNLALAVSAFEAIRRVRADARMVWVGDGPQRPSLQADHPDHVFTGWRGGEDLAAHYACGDLFLFPSLTETFGNVTLEALASGVPVVAFACAAAADLVLDNGNGVCVTAGDTAAFAVAAAALAADADRLAEMRRRAPGTVAQHDWRAIADAFETLLGTLAFDRAAAPRSTQ